MKSFYYLLNKLQATGLDHRVVNWVRNYLNYWATAKSSSESSNSLPVLSGVPQESVLGRLLFLVYINGVMNIDLTSGSFLNLFADDIHVLLHKIVCSEEDFAYLQNDLDKLNNWIKLNLRAFNPTKCKSILISRRRNTAQPPSLLLYGSKLEQVSHYKYLCILRLVMV